MDDRLGYDVLEKEFYKTIGNTNWIIMDRQLMSFKEIIWNIEDHLRIQFEEELNYEN